MSAIKVLVVDDSALIREMLTALINADARMMVVGTAIDPIEARQKIKDLQPDVLTLDIEMPKMDGITFLKNLMRLRPMPVVMVSTLTAKGAQITMDALSIGAIDYVTKPKQNDGLGLQSYGIEICNKIAVASKVKQSVLEARSVASSSTVSRTVMANYKPSPTALIALGASTGGTEAIKEVLLSLPSNCPPIVVAQHIPATFSTSFSERLNRNCVMNVVEAKDGDKLEIGTAYIAPGDDHLRIVKRGGMNYISIDKGEPVNRHRPSVDVLFDSIAESGAQGCVAAILTGMGSDGAKGLLHLKQAGALTIAQDEDTCVVWGMPGAAVKVDAAQEVLPLTSIAQSILNKTIDRRFAEKKRSAQR